MKHFFSFPGWGRALWWGAAGLAGGLAPGPLAAAPARAPRAAPAATSLEFIENKGQWDARARYAASLPGGRLFLENAALTYLFVDPAVLRRHGDAPAADETAPAAPADQVAAHAYSVHFEGASRQAHPVAAEPTGAARNYFHGADPRRWGRGAGGFRRVRYAGLWPGIDAAVYENAGQRLEYDFALAPGADAGRVALRYEGAQALTLDAATGGLAVATAVGTVTELAPRAWQTDAQGRHQPVACRYALAGRTVRFVLGPYDHRRALTIDPTVVFSSFTGSTADNWGFTATYDQAGNLYSGGIAFEPGYPATRGALQTTFGGLCDVALIKYNTQATGPAARVWATYLGGGSTEFPHSLVANAAGELVVLGSTSSAADFPTTAGALSRRFGGGTRLEPFGSSASKYVLPNGADLFVARLSADGSALLASTYLGGSGNDGVLDAGTASPASQRLAANYGDTFRGDVLLDGAGNVYVASNTASADFPGLGAGFNGAFRGGASDGVVCKLNPGLTAVLWAGLLGGRGADAAYSVQRDDRGRVYVAGGTLSPDFPATAGAYRAARPGGVDGFAARISADGRTLERATYVGTAGYDQAQFLQLDAAGNAYLLGQTLGGAFPVTAGLYANRGGAQFVQKLDPDLTASVYSTVFGSGGSAAPNLVPTAFLVDDCERIYVSGWGGRDNGGHLGGSTAGLPVSANAVQKTTDGSDFYLAEFLPGMAGLEYATFFGELGGVGEHVDGGTSRFDKRGIVYQAVCGGCSGTQGFPVPPGANTYSRINGSFNCNNAAFKIDFQAPRADAGPRRALCASAAPVPLGGAPAGGVWTGPGVRRTAGGGYEFVPSAAGPGAFLLTYTVATSGICQAMLRVRYQVAPAAVPAFVAVGPRCVSSPAVALVGTPAGGTFSGPGVTGSSFSPQAAGAGTHTLTYTVADSLACGAATQQVVVSPALQALVSPDTTLCADQRRPFQLRGSPAGGTWSGPGVSPAGLFTPPDTQNRGGAFALTYAVAQGPCQATATRRVVLAPANLTDVPLNLPVCAAAPQYAGLAPFDCPLLPLLAGGTYSWDFGDGSPASTEAAPTHRYARAGSYHIRLTARYAGCEVLTQFAPLEVGDVFVPNVITANDDALNATFQPRFTCRPASLKVFSRWGQEVYATADYHNDWDAHGLPAGLYYYLLRDADARQVKGWVQVVR